MAVGVLPHEGTARGQWDLPVAVPVAVGALPHVSTALGSGVAGRRVVQTRLLACA